MQEVSGTVFVGESNRIAGPLKARAWGPVWLRYALLFGPGLIGLVAFLSIKGVLWDLFGIDLGNLAPAIIWLVGLAIGVLSLQHSIRLKSLRKVLAVSPDGKFPTHFMASAAHFSAADATGTVQYNWVAIHELFLDSHHWVVVGTPIAFIIPRRFFADLTAEKAFIAEMLSFMTPEAQAKSKSAQKWLKSAG